MALEGGIWSLFSGDGRINGGVELHFSVNEPVGVVRANFVDDEVDFFEVRIFAARTVGGIGKHGDFGGVLVVGLVSGGGIFNDSIKLIGGREFVDAAVGED